MLIVNLFLIIIDNKMYILKLRFLILFLAAVFTFVSCELFTAVVDLEKLLYTEGEVIKTIEQYIEMEEKRLQEIRKYV